MCLPENAFGFFMVSVPHSLLLEEPFSEVRNSLLISITSVYASLAIYTELRPDDGVNPLLLIEFERH